MEGKGREDGREGKEGGKEGRMEGKKEASEKATKRKLALTRLCNTVPQITLWSFMQPVNKEPATILHSDFSAPLAAAFIFPVKTNLTSYDSLSCSGMFTTKPAWCVRTTPLHGHTTLRHFSAFVFGQTIPASFHSVVTSLRGCF